MLISEVSRLSGLSRYTIRFYEREGLLRKGGRRENNYRDFNEDALYNLQFVDAARKLGFSLKEIRQFIRAFSQRQDHNQIVSTLEKKLGELNAKLDGLTIMRDQIQSLLHGCGLNPGRGKPTLKDLVSILRQSEPGPKVRARNGRSRKTPG